MLTIKKMLSPARAQAMIAEHAKRARLDRNHSRDKAAELTGVPAATIKQFETTGKISLHQFLSICFVYGDLSKTVELFPELPPESIDDLVKRAETPKRQRGRSS